MSDSQPVPASSVLLVLGGASGASGAGAEASAGNGSASLLAVLRKHGWLDTAVAEPTVLSDSAHLRRHDVLIVARIEEWQASWLRGLRAFDGIMFLEGPIPPLVERFAGIERVPQERPLAYGRLRVRQWLRTALTSTGCELDREHLDLVPPAWELLCDRLGELRGDAVADLAAAYAAVYTRRLRTEGAAFRDSPVNDGLALIALALYAEKLADGSERERLLELIELGIFGEPASAGGAATGLEYERARPSSLHQAASLIAAALRGPAQVRGAAAAAAAEVPEPGPHADEGELPAAHAYAAALRGDSAGLAEWVQAAGLGGDVLPKQAVSLWLCAAARDAQGDADRRVGFPWLTSLAADIDTAEGRLPPALDRWRVTELVPLAGALDRCDLRAAAGKLLRAVVAGCFDTGSGRLRQGRVEDGVLVADSTLTVAPAVLLGLLDRLPRALSAAPAPGDAAPRGDPLVPASPLKIASYRNVGADDQLLLERADESRVGVARRGRVLVSSFPLLSHLAHAEELSRSLPAPRPPGSGLEALERAFFLLLEDQLVRYGREMLLVRPPSADDAAARVRKVADEREHCAYELHGEGLAEELEVRFVCARELVQGAALDGADIEVVEPRPPSEGVGLCIGPGGGQPRRLHIQRVRPARFDELAGAIAARGDRAPVEYAADEIMPRLSSLTEVVNHFSPATDITQLRVGDVGCGYGPFPLTMHLVERPRQLVGLDISAESIAVARQLAAALGAEDIHFAQDDVLVLKEVEQLDLLLCLNVLYYLTARQDRERAANASFRALRPGGVLVALLTNRLHARDEFTGLRWVHRMPRRLADVYVRRRGVAEGYHARSPSPSEVLRTYRRAGFGPVTLIDPDQMRPITRPRDYRKPRFYLVATKPAP